VKAAAVAVAGADLEAGVAAEGAAATAGVAAVDAAEAGATGKRFRHSKLLSEAARLGVFSTGMSRRIPFAENLALLISHFNFQRSFFSSCLSPVARGALDCGGAQSAARRHSNRDVMWA
jgi:hypothetical protein